MIHGLYGILDAKAGVYSGLMQFPADGVAARDFGDAINDPKSNIYAHPEDYTLYKLGTYDMLSGEVVALEQPGLVAVGKTVALPRSGGIS